jgi:hypothetical protein
MLRIVRVSLLIDLPKLFIELRWMTGHPRKYRLGTQQRPALQFLAGSPFGAAEAAIH